MLNESQVYKNSYSSLEIELEDSQFYIPGEVIRGSIKLNPDNPKDYYEIKLKLIQYEFWDYVNTSFLELNKVNTEEVITKTIPYKLYGPILNNEISIPFVFEINENNKLLPTFQYQNDKIFMGIRHLLVAEYGKHECLNHKGLFIGKIPNKFYLSNTYRKTDDLSINIFKQSFFFGETLNYDIKIKPKSSLKKVQYSICRIIQLDSMPPDKKEFQRNDFSNDNFNFNYGKLINIPGQAITGGTFFGLIGAYKGLNYGTRWYHNIIHNIIHNVFPHGYNYALLGAFGMAIYGAINIVVDTFSKQNSKEINHNCTNDIPSQSMDEESLAKNLEKFVYFKDKKVVGFIKFENDITPPVNGRFFKCNYYIEVNGSPSTVPNNDLKIDIDFYDGEQYYRNMKSLFRIEQKRNESKQCDEQQPINGQFNEQTPFNNQIKSSEQVVYNEQSTFNKRAESNELRAPSQQPPSYGQPPFYGQHLPYGQPPSYGQPPCYSQPPLYGQPGCNNQPYQFYCQPPYYGQQQLPSYIPPSPY